MNLPTGKRKKVLSALTGVLIAEKWPDYKRSAKLVESSRPASYLIGLALEQLSGKKLPRPFDKSEWAVAVSFKGEVFEISDWRRSAWNIYGLPDKIEGAKALAQKLSAAGTVLDRHLQEVCRELLVKEDFSLDNQYFKYRSLFEDFTIKCTNFLLKRERPLQSPNQETTDLNSIAKQIEYHLNAWVEDSTQLHINLIAASIFFFSLSEIILDACFALGDRKGKSYKDFRGLDWGERFRLILPISEARVARIYENLLRIRRFYRNVHAHAIPTYIFQIRGLGLVPASFEDLDNPGLRHLFHVNDDDVRNNLDCFSQALDLLEHHPATEFGFAYAESGLAIHISEARLLKFRAQMMSLEGFKDFLRTLGEYADAVANMDV